MSASFHSDTRLDNALVSGSYSRGADALAKGIVLWQDTEGGSAPTGDAQVRHDVFIVSLPPNVRRKSPSCARPIDQYKKVVGAHLFSSCNAAR